MEKLQTKMVKVLSGIANSMVDKETREWPPKCFLLTYQPTRPGKKLKAEIHQEDR